MKKTITVLLAAWFFCLGIKAGISAQEIAWEGISGEKGNLKTVLVHPVNPQTIYIGSSSAVSKSEDAGKSWKDILRIKGQNKSVYCLLFDPAKDNVLYAATGSGLFYTYNGGRSWKKIFRGKNYLENECRALAVSLPYIYLGTAAGLFTSNDGGRSWHRAAGPVGRSNVSAIVCEQKDLGNIYLASANGLFQSKDKGISWEKIFFASSAERDDSVEEPSEAEEGSAERFFNLRHIAQDPAEINILYLSTSKGIYQSLDKGRNWDLFPDGGLIRSDIVFLLVSGQSELIAANKAGVFRYEGGRWQELSLGLAAAEVSFLALDSQNNLYAASDKGLFKAVRRRLLNKVTPDTLALYIKGEPEICDVQKAAVRYAEVEPEKIKEWRRQAAKRALLPRFSLSLDRDRNRTISSNIWGIYGNGTIPGRYFIGPDDQTRYNNNNWSLAFTWELGDLIYNDDQTSIDVRSRLNTQLRQDILDEVTRLYFERLRIKMELDNLPIENKKKRFEKELKLEELAALLDGLTGGYFSQHSKRNGS